jgi:hypothetical protein
MKFYEFEEILVYNNIKIESFEKLFKKINSIKYYIPIPFFFTREFRHIPEIARQYHEVKIDIKFADFKDLIITSNSNV